MKKRVLIVSGIIVAILAAAILTKPSDKQIKITVIESIWGDRVPDKYNKPQFYELFMNTTTPAVIIDDWLFMKRVRYLIGKQTQTIGYAAFGKTLIR